MKEEIKKLYEDHPLNLYLILRNLYFMREADQEYAVYLYKQMINKLNKSNIIMIDIGYSSYNFL